MEPDAARRGPLQLPGDLLGRLGQIGAERPGTDASIEVISERVIVTTDQLKTGADVLGHQRTRPLGVREILARPAAMPHGGAELVAQQLDLVTDSRGRTRLFRPR